MQPSHSAGSSNLVLVKKKEGKLKFCTHYCRLNEVTIKDAYPLPRISARLDALGEAKYLSTFNLRRRNFQVYMNPGDACNTTFLIRGDYISSPKCRLGFATCQENSAINEANLIRS